MDIKNQLPLNIYKTVYMTFTNYREKIPRKTDIQLNSQKVSRVNCTKYLGITIGTRMKWNLRISNTVKILRYLMVT